MSFRERRDDELLRPFAVGRDLRPPCICPALDVRQTGKLTRKLQGVFARQTHGLQVIRHARRAIHDADLLHAVVGTRRIVDDMADLRKARRLKSIQSRSRLEARVERQAKIRTIE